MKLYNCYSPKEKELKSTELQELTTAELLILADKIKEDFKDEVLEDEIIVVDALSQIVGELGKRVAALEGRILEQLIKDITMKSKIKTPFRILEAYDPKK